MTKHNYNRSSDPIDDYVRKEIEGDRTKGSKPKSDSTVDFIDKELTRMRIDKVKLISIM